MKRFFGALGRGLLFALLFIGVQLIVSMNALIAYAIFAVTKGVLSGGFDFFSMSQALMDFVREYSNLLTIASAVITILLLWLILRTGKRRLLPEIHLSAPRPWLALAPAALAGAAFAFAISFGMELLPIPESLLESYGEASGLLAGGNPVIGFIASVIAAPIVEETVFRGLVYTRFKMGMPMIVALLLESAIFGLMHGNWLWTAYAFVLGIVLTLVFEGSGSILGSIAFHVAFNLFGAYVTPYLAITEPIVMYATVALALAVAVACGVWMANLRNKCLRAESACTTMTAPEPDATHEEPEPEAEPLEKPTDEE